jgi:ribose transport system permease protein
MTPLASFASTPRCSVEIARLFAPSFLDFGVILSVILCVLLGTVIGLLNGVLVTFLKVPAFIATQSMLFIGRGFALALTHGQAIYYADKLKSGRDHRQRRDSGVRT